MKSDTESPSPRPAVARTGRRAPSSPTKIPSSGPPIGKIAPYVVAGLVVAVLAFLIRTPRFVEVGTLAIGLVTMATLGYFAFAERLKLPPDDKLRLGLPVVAVLVLIAAAVPFVYTIYPPHPAGRVTLAANGAGSVQVSNPALTVWLTVRGRFVPSATGNATYFLTVDHDGAASEHIDGALHPHAGGPLPEYHLLAGHGPGRYTVRLEQVSGSVALPLSVDVTPRPFATWLLAILYAALAVLILTVDTMLWRRGAEPAFAASMLLPLFAVIYFQHQIASNAIKTDLLTAGIIGAVGGGIGGEILARLVRTVVRK